jgi:endonuclease YncB( thermonuclease family)
LPKAKYLLADKAYDADHWRDHLKARRIQPVTDRYGRVVAVCRAGHIDLNAWMVGHGWAVAYRHFSMDYVRDEDEARSARKGVWRGRFVMPWEWRKSHR